MAEGPGLAEAKKPGDPVSSSPGEALLKRIEFHPARKPFSAIGIAGGDFHLETLNPSSEFHRPAPSSGPTAAPAPVCSSGVPGKRSGCGEFNERGWDPELSFEITFRRIGAGLRNLGNTCFLNSVLQCLTYTAPFAAYLQSGKHKSSCRTAGFCAMCALQNHVMNALQSTGKIVTPLHLVKNLRCISRNFRNCRQEDAHEYMVNLLESMHKCCLPSGVPSESPSAYEKSLVHKIFGGHLRSQVKCMQCSYCSNKFDPFLDLSLEIVKADTLRKALSHFTAQEQLDGGERQYQCQRCKQKVRALKQLTIHKAPYILSVHLKRFSSDVPGQKINKRIEFGPTLDLKPFVSDPKEGDLGYTLYGVLVHAGYSTHSGHYYCFVRTSSGMWHSLDDNQVYQVSEKTVLEQKAYMLFYVRNIRGSAPKRLPDIVCKENIAASAPGNNVLPVSSSDLKNTIHPKTERIVTTSEHHTTIPKAIISSNGKSIPVKGISSEDLILNKASTLLTNGHVAKESHQSTLLANPELDPSSKISSLKDPLPKGPHVLIMSGNPSVAEGFVDSASCKSNDSQLVEDKADMSVVGGEVKWVSSKGNLSAQRIEVKDHLPSDFPVVGKESVVQQSKCNGLPKAAPEKFPIESGMHESGNVVNRKGQISDTPCTVVEDLEPDKINPLKLPNHSSTTDILVALRPSSVRYQDSVVKERCSSDPVGEKARESFVKGTALVDHSNKQSFLNGYLQKDAMERLGGDSQPIDVKRKILPKCSLLRSMHFGPRRLFLATISLRKKKKHKKSMKRSLNARSITKNKVVGDSILGDQGTSTSETVKMVDDDTTCSRKKRSHSSLNKENGLHVVQDVNCHNDDSVKPKDGDAGVRCVKDSAETNRSLDARQHDTEDIDASSKSSQRGFLSLLTRGLGETTVARWDDVDLPPSQIHGLSHEPNGSIGYVLDEWDVEYDQGKRKKVKKSSKHFSGTNPFQEIATIKTQQIMKMKRAQTSSGNLPFRI